MLHAVIEKSTGVDVKPPYVYHMLLKIPLLQSSCFVWRTLKILAMFSFSILIWEYLMRMLAYWASLRSGHAHHVETAHGSFDKLRSGLHQMYRQLDIKDDVMTMCIPQSLQQQMRTRCSFNTISIPFTGQDWDFKMEELNNVTKGVFTSRCWKYVRRTTLFWSELCKYQCRP